jgi:hypothetical protein
MSKDLLSICKGPRNPSLEDMTTLGHFGCLHDALSLALPCTDKKDETASSGDFFDNLGRSS